MAPVRLDLTARLCEALGVFDADGVEVVGAEVATDELLATIHDADYVAAVKAASVDPSQADDGIRPRHRGRPGLRGHARGERPGRLRAPSTAAGAVWKGEAEHAVNFTGGLHHAMRGKAD